MEFELYSTDNGKLCEILSEKEDMAIVKILSLTENQYELLLRCRKSGNIIHGAYKTQFKTFSEAKKTMEFLLQKDTKKFKEPFESQKKKQDNNDYGDYDILEVSKGR